MSAVPSVSPFAESRTPLRRGVALPLLGVAALVVLLLRPLPAQPLRPPLSVRSAVAAVDRVSEPIGVFQRFRLPGGGAPSGGQHNFTVEHAATNSTPCHFRSVGANGHVPCECVRRISTLALRHPPPFNRFLLYRQEHNASGVAEFTLSAENVTVSVRNADGTLFRPFRATVSLSVAVGDEERKQCATAVDVDPAVAVDVELRYRPLDHLTERMLGRNEYHTYGYYGADGTVALERQSVVLSASGRPSTLTFDCTSTLRRGWYALRVAMVPWMADAELRKGNDAPLKWVLLNATNDDADATTTTTTATATRAATRTTTSAARRQPVSLGSMPPPPLHLWLRNDSIFPSCADALTLSWRLPQIADCDASAIRDRMDFRVRLYASAVDATDEWIYVEEFGGGSGGGGATTTNYTAPSSSWRDHFVEIPCSRFDIVHERFCFELVSVERVTRHFERWHRKCVDTEPRQKAVEAVELGDDESTSLSWSAWSAWSACVARRAPGRTAECSGGIRKRTRQCLSPQHGPTSARHCRRGRGGELDAEFCRPPHGGGHADCGDGSARTLAARTRSTCECGCNVTVSGKTDSGGTLFVNVSPRCQGDAADARPLEWRIVAAGPSGLGLTVVEEPPRHVGWLRIYRVDADGAKRFLWENNNNNNNFNNNDGDFSRETKLSLIPYAFRSSSIPTPLGIVALIEAASTPSGIYGEKTKPPGGFYVRFHALVTESGSAPSSADNSLRRAGTTMDDLLFRHRPPVVAALGAAALFLVGALVALLPPVLCARLTVRRYVKWHGASRRISAAGGRLLPSTSSDNSTTGGGDEKRWRPDTTYSNYNNVDETNVVFNMQRSMANTDSTRLTVASTSLSSSVGATNARQCSVTRRSIGIQLSRQSTPQLGGSDTPRQLREDSAKNLLSARRRRQRQNNNRSQPSSANSTSVDVVVADELLEDEADALEYDYYEPPPPPGSFLHNATPGGGEEPPWMELVSEISDIVFSDAIYSPPINGGNTDKELLYNNNNNNTDHEFKATITETCDAHTQIPLSTLYSVYSFNNDGDNESECVTTSCNSDIHSRIHIV